MRVYGMLENGMGGLDWAGLPLVAEMLGVDDPQMLIVRLETIKKPAAFRDSAVASQE